MKLDRVCANELTIHTHLDLPCQKIGLNIALPSLRNRNCAAQESLPASLVAQPACMFPSAKASLMTFIHFSTLSLAGLHLRHDQLGIRSTPRTRNVLPHSIFPSATASLPRMALTNLAMQSIACSAQPGLIVFKHVECMEVYMTGTVNECTDRLRSNHPHRKRLAS